MKIFSWSVSLLIVLFGILETAAIASDSNNSTETSLRAMIPSQSYVPPHFTRQPTKAPTPYPTPTPSPTQPLPPTSQRGDVTCKYGDADCNMCANDVEATFLAAFESGGMNWKTWKWHFRYDKTYNPAGKKATSGGIASSLVYKHIQGFVRTNNDTTRYAASHSHEEGHNGGYFFINKGSTRNYLSYMHLAKTDHPYSVAELGQYVVSAEDSDVRFFDLRKIDKAQDVTKHIPGLNVGGGMAMAKLADGSHLLVASFKGGRGDGTRKTDFYRWEGPLKTPTTVLKLAQVPYSQPGSWSGNYMYSDNLSLITECGSGKLYTIHTSGDEDLIKSKGYWRLSRVDWDSSGKPTLKTLHGRSQDQNMDNCHLRSSGTVHVNKANGLEFFCHERNVVEGLFEDADYFSFKFGTPNA